MAHPMPIARNAQGTYSLLPGRLNRHGLITGATGTGKTVTLQTLAEQCSRQGIPVFLADVKGDLSGISQAGAVAGAMADILRQRGLEMPEPLACPVTFWDVFGQQGHPVRATVSDMGPLLLARMLGLNEIQTGVLQLVFKIADDQGLLLLDSKDLRAMLQYVGDHARDFTTGYGTVSAASIGAIQRGLLQIETEGGDRFFGEPMLNLRDCLQTDHRGLGVVNVLAADRLLQAPRLYGAFLLWLLSELFEQLPEIGDPDKPVLVFFFDEAHLLFQDAPPVLLERIELVVRLVRSKGVGVFFVSQNPLDIPEIILGQLGNRIHHALRAYTPRDQKAVRAAAETMRPNPGLDLAAAMTELAVGEALVSVLDAQGRPSPTQRAFILPPGGRIGPISAVERQQAMAASLVAGVYDQTLDRDSAYERLTAGSPGKATKAGRPTTPTPPPHSSPPRPAGDPASGEPPADQPAPARDGLLSGMADILFGSTGPRGGHHEGVAEAVLKSAARSVGSSIGREIIRGVLGSILGGRRR